MDECIASLDEAQVFSTLDANYGYWQIKIDDNVVDETAFATHHRLFCYKRMPFGLKNAPTTFQRAMSFILASIKWQFSIVYTDNIVVFTQSARFIFLHKKKVPRLLMNAGMKLKLKKCQIFCEFIDYHGHVIAPSKLQVAREAKEAI